MLHPSSAGPIFNNTLITRPKKFRIERERKSNLLQSLKKGLASHCKAEATFIFHSSILTLLNAFQSTNNREMKSESVFSFAMASQPFQKNLSFI